MIEFNLVPKNLRNRSHRAINWLRVGTIFAVALTVVAVSGSVFNQMSLGIYQREVESQRPTIANVERLERELRDIRRENQLLSQEITRLEGLGDPNGAEAFLRFLDSLAAITTDGILLDNVEYNRGGSILVAGVSIDAEEISHYFDRVKQIEGVQEASLSQLGRPAGDESPLRRFELRLAWQAGG